MDIHLDHIAIAVKKIDDSKSIFETLGFRFSDEREEVESQKVLTAFAQIDQHAHIELLEPTSEDSTIAKFIQRQGEGIHHLSFRVQDIKKTQDKLEKEGYRLIYKEAIDGAGNCLVNFIHPKSANGTLIEISEKKGDQ